jgi:hypothetical protein
MLGFVEPQQAVIHEHAGQLIADGLVQERRRHRAVHPAGQPEQNVFPAHLGADAGHGLGHVVAHLPVARVPQMSRTKRRSTAAPCLVWVTSGWNCRP